MEIFGDCTPDDWANDSAETEEQHFDRTCVFSRQAERCGILVVDFVDHLVESRGMQRTVRPIMPCVFHDEEDSDLISHCEEGGEGDAG